MGKLSKYQNKISALFMVLYGILTGVIVGIVLYGFKQLASYILTITVEIFEFVRNNLWYAPLLFIGLASLSYLVYLIIKKEPNAGSGAIPRAEGFLRGLMTFRWLRTTLATMFSSLMVFFAGLPYGIEGPSVILGTTLSGGVSKLGKANPALNRYILTSGASAGFTVATGSPLAGVMFSLEEMHKRFSFLLLIVAMSGASFAAVTVKILDHIFDTSSVFFPIGEIKTLPINLMWLTLIIGIFAGTVATLFNKSLEKMNHVIDTKLKKITPFLKLLINFLLVGIGGLILVESLGNGHHLLLEAMNRQILWSSLLLLFIFKFILIAASVGSGVTGGLFVPSLVIGGLSGALLNEVFIASGLDVEYTKIIVVLAMGAFFGTSIHAPITTVVFMIEATQNPYNVMAMILSLLVAMITGHIFKNESSNDTVLEKLLRKQDGHKTPVIYEIIGKVSIDAFVINKPARDILWPASSIISSVKRNDETKGYRMVKGGDKMIKENDTLIFHVQSYDIDKTKIELSDLIGAQEFKVKQLH